MSNPKDRMICSAERREELEGDDSFEVTEAQYAADLEEAFEDLRAERSVSLEVFKAEMRQKHGIPD